MDVAIYLIVIFGIILIWLKIDNEGAKIRRYLRDKIAKSERKQLTDVSKRTCMNCSRLYTYKRAAVKHEEYKCLFDGNYLTDAKNHKCDNWIC